MATTSTVRKVTYIKINKIDEYGNDNTLSLQELTSLRIVFSDLGIVNFPIATITEYPTYYLYSTNEILPNNATSSIDNNVLDYNFSASALSTPYTFPIGGYFNFFTSSYNISSLGTANSFDSNTGTYSVFNTNNTPLTFTASFTINNTGADSIFIFFALGTYPIISNFIPVAPTTLTVFPGTNTYSVTSSQIYLRENTTYLPFIYYDPDGSPDPTIISNLQWKFTQSIAPYGPISNLTVLSPYLTENFEYSDCNVLFNNATNLEYNPNFYKVNYDTGLLIPTNQQQILDGTAEFAPVKPYNYSLNAQIFPRYIGTRYSSDGVNNPSTTNVRFELSFDRVNYGTFTNENSAPVRSLKTALAYIDWWGGWPPEKMNASGAHIKYIIDENGETVTPNITNYSLYTNQGTFVSNETVDVASINQTTPTDSTRNIFRGATRIEPIIYNQLRHYEDGPMTFTGSIRFTDRNPLSTDTINDYTLTLRPDIFYPIQSNPEPDSGIFNNVIVAKGANITDETGSLNNRYTVTQNVIDEHVDLVLTANMKITSLPNSNFAKSSIGFT